MSPDERFLVMLLGVLKDVGLEVVVVGSTAAVLQGAPVMTHDVDLLIGDTPRNREKLVELCRALGAHPMEVSPLSSVRTLVGADIPIDILFDSLPGALQFEALSSRVVRSTPVLALIGRPSASRRGSSSPRRTARAAGPNPRSAPGSSTSPRDLPIERSAVPAAHLPAPSNLG